MVGMIAMRGETEALRGLAAGRTSALNEDKNPTKLRKKLDKPILEKCELVCADGGFERSTSNNTFVGFDFHSLRKNFMQTGILSHLFCRVSGTKRGD